MSDKIQWTESGKQQIIDLKKMIVKKKIMLGFMIDDYSLLDRRFRYVHTALATSIPLISFINEMVTGNTDQTAMVTLVLSGIVAGMIKIKDTLKFGKIVVIAQQQTVKYKQLYQRIEREMNKHESKRESEESFIYWVNREYNNIEMADPELTHNMKKKFIELCKAKGIPYDEDMEALNNLLGDVTQELTQVVVQKATEELANAVVTYADVERETKKEVKEEVKEAKLSSNVTVVEEVKKEKSTEKTTPEQHQRRMSTIRIRSTSDEVDRKQYKETMKAFNPTEDMQWALDRLTDIQQ